LKKSIALKSILLWSKSTLGQVKQATEEEKLKPIPNVLGRSTTLTSENLQPGKKTKARRRIISPTISLDFPVHPMKIAILDKTELA
jgi:hypothetical protein